MTSALLRPAATRHLRRPASQMTPRRVLESAAMTDTAPGTSNKRVYPSGPAQVPAGYQVPADTVELDYHDVAVLLTHLAAHRGVHAAVLQTQRQHARTGLSAGRTRPRTREKIKCWAKGPRERDPQPGERIGSVNRWRASTIIAWNDTRKGGGFWRENQTTDSSTTPQPATDTRTPRKVKRARTRSDSADPNTPTAESGTPPG